MNFDEFVTADDYEIYVKQAAPYLAAELVELSRGLVEDFGWSEEMPDVEYFSYYLLGGPAGSGEWWLKPLPHHWGFAAANFADYFLAYDFMGESVQGREFREVFVGLLGANSDSHSQWMAELSSRANLLANFFTQAMILHSREVTLKNPHSAHDHTSKDTQLHVQQAVGAVRDQAVKEARSAEVIKSPQEVQEFWDDLYRNNNEVLKFSPANGNDWRWFKVFRNAYGVEGVAVLKMGDDPDRMEDFLREYGLVVIGSGQSAKLEGGGISGPGKIAVYSDYDHAKIAELFRRWVSKKKVVFDRSPQLYSENSRAAQLAEARAIAENRKNRDPEEVKRMLDRPGARAKPVQRMSVQEVSRLLHGGGPESGESHAPVAGSREDCVLAAGRDQELLPWKDNSALGGGEDDATGTSYGTVEIN
jgi:hypothetical protein